MTDLGYPELWQRQRSFSERVWGTERGPVGPLRHLLRELDELAQASAPDAVLECADVLILAIDAARRAGVSPPKINPNAPSAGRLPCNEVAELTLAAALRGEHAAWRYFGLITSAYDLGAEHGLTHAELTAAAFVKVLINERRVWSAPDADGVSEHVREATPNGDQRAAAFRRTQVARGRGFELRELELESPAGRAERRLEYGW